MQSLPESQLSLSFFLEIDKMILICIWELKGPRITNTILKRIKLEMYTSQFHSSWCFQDHFGIFTNYEDVIKHTYLFSDYICVIHLQKFIITHKQDDIFPSSKPYSIFLGNFKIWMLDGSITLLKVSSGNFFWRKYRVFRIETLNSRNNQCL